MDENELKAIWQKSEKVSVNKIDFEVIKQKSIASQNKLKKRFKKEVIVCFIVYAALLPIFYFNPKVLFLTPFLILIWVWYLWELKRINQIEMDFQNHENLREILQTKRKYLRGYFQRNRYLSWICAPILLLLSLIVFTSWDQMLQNPRPFLNILILVEVVVVIFVEIWLRIAYKPFLDEIEDLLRQLNESP
ncbi:MAG: hypothetical protein K1X72_02890 [Pyrinomonadaceae bacterium]|nr:hypothetical protein [Pyrinomonadaceae bacterium]